MKLLPKVENMRSFLKAQVLIVESTHKGMVMSNEKKKMVLFATLALVLCLFSTEYAFASVESSLTGLKTKLVTVILPVLSVIGIAIAGVSFFTGNPNAKQHIAYAVLGCIIGFGSQAIVDLLKSVVS